MAYYEELERAFYRKHVEQCFNNIVGALHGGPPDEEFEKAALADQQLFREIVLTQEVELATLATCYAALAYLNEFADSRSSFEMGGLDGENRHEVLGRLQNVLFRLYRLDLDMSRVLRDMSITRSIGRERGR